MVKLISILSIFLVLNVKAAYINQVQITDNTNTAAVKAASVAPIATDPALVVAISPNSSIDVTSVPPVLSHVNGSITTACPTLAGCAATSYVLAYTNGNSNVGYSTSGTWVGAITTDVSYDSTCAASPGSAVWFNQGSFDVDDSEATYLSTWSENRDDRPWVMNVSAAACMRVRAQALSSGTVAVHINSGVGTAAVWALAVGNIAAGQADKGNPIKAGGKYSLALPTLDDGDRGDLQLDINGRLLTSSSQSGTWNINNISGAIALPTGASTSSNQSTIISSLATMQSGQNTFLDKSSSGTIAALNDELVLNINGTSTVGVQITGTWVGNILLQATQDGSNWWNERFYIRGTGAVGTTIASNTTAFAPISGASQVRLRASAWTSGTAAVTLTASAGTSIMMAVQQSAGSLTTAATQNGTWNITNISGTVSLPTGASTAANQATEIASLSSIDGKIVAVNTGAVVVSSSALPTGAATSANQTTTNSSLSSIDTKTPALGQATMANSSPVVIASNQSAIPVSQSGTWTVQPGNTPNTTPWLVVQRGNSYVMINSATTTAIKSGTGTLRAICLNTHAGNGHVLTVYDNTAGSGTQIAILTTGGQMMAGNCSPYNLSFATGLTIVSTGTSNWTVVYE